MSAPTITPLDPINGETGVAKDHAIKFSAVAVGGVEADSLSVLVDGLLIYEDEQTVADGWLVLVDAITNGYTVIATPADRSTYYTSNEDVIVGAEAEATLGGVTNETWTFSTTRNIRLGIYTMLLGGVRAKDEEQG